MKFEICEGGYFPGTNTRGFTCKNFGDTTAFDFHSHSLAKIV